MLSKNILEDTLDKIQSNISMKLITNNQYNTYLAPKIKSSDYRIDWTEKAFNIHNKIRALSYKGAYALYSNKRIKFYDTYYSNRLLNIGIGHFLINEDKLLIATFDGHIESIYIQIEGSKKISSIDFINSCKSTIKKFD